LVGTNKSNSNTKSKTLSEEEMESRGANAIRVPKKGLDTADFLIDGLTCGRAYGAQMIVEQSLSSTQSFSNCGEAGLRAEPRASGAEIITGRDWCRAGWSAATKIKGDACASPLI